jgi:hypothetical protein
MLGNQPVLFTPCWAHSSRLASSPDAESTLFGTRSEPSAGSIQQEF